jgi:hypothetical protein
MDGIFGNLLLKLIGRPDTHESDVRPVDSCGYSYDDSLTLTTAVNFS